MTSILLTAFFALTISGNGGQAPQVQDSGTVDQAVETEAVAEGERKIESEDIEAAVTAGAGMLWLTDRHGRQVGIPAARIAYVDLGTSDSGPKIGFGA